MKKTTTDDPTNDFASNDGKKDLFEKLPETTTKHLSVLNNTQQCATSEVCNLQQGRYYQKWEARGTLSCLNDFWVYTYVGF